MEKRLGFVGIIIENRKQAAPAVNDVLTAFGDSIIGRMGIPHVKREHSVIVVIVVATFAYGNSQRNKQASTKKDTTTQSSSSSKSTSSTPAPSTTPTPSTTPSTSTTTPTIENGVSLIGEYAALAGCRYGCSSPL